MRKASLYSIALRLVACLPGTLFSVLCYAQFNDVDDESELLGLYGDMEMVSVATGSKQPIAKAPAVATVITAATIQDMGATDIDDVLETVPGLHISRDVIGYNPQYLFRGIASSFNPEILMLINGIPLTNLFHGDRSLEWGGMPVNAIARIEVIRGPGSAVYGADAFAGVINIITKSAKDIKETEVGVRAGSFDSRDAWVLAGKETNDYEFGLAIEYHDSEGHREKISSDAQTGLDAAFGTNASLAPGPVNLQRRNLDIRVDVASELWRLRAGLQQRRNLGSGAGIGQALDPDSRYQSDRWNADLTYHNPKWNQDWDVTAQLSVLDANVEMARELIVFPPGTNVGFGVLPNGLIGNPEVFERHYRFNASAFYRNFDRHLIRSGMGYFYGDIYKVKESKNFGPDPTTGLPLPLNSPVIDVSDTPFVFLPERDRSNYHFFFQDIWSLSNDWELTTGVRYDDFSDFGSTTNPRGALVWSTTQRLTSKVLFGRAFRAPSFAEQYNKGSPVALGNPDIKPETIDSWEIAFDYQLNRDVRYAVNFFRYTWDDIILFVPNMDASVAQNAGKQTGKGVEFDMNWTMTNNLQLLANYAYQKSTDKNSREDAGRTPEHQIYFNINWAVNNYWNINSTLTWVMNRARQPGDTRSEIDDYRLVDISLRRSKLAGHWGIALTARNLFDSDAREPSPLGVPTASIADDLPLAGRSVLLELSYRI